MIISPSLWNDLKYEISQNFVQLEPVEKGYGTKASVVGF